MTQELEWGGVQQLLLLAKSTLLGGVLGLLLDLSDGIRFGFSKALRFSMDIIVGALSAVITFFFCLVVTDGRLHPALFCGLAIGAVAEHCLVGRKLCCGIIKIKRFVRMMHYRIGCQIRRFVGRIGALVDKILFATKEKFKNIKKTQKICHFFQKKS